jgi:hypothetical protein
MLIAAFRAAAQTFASVESPQFAVALARTGVLRTLYDFAARLLTSAACEPEYAGYENECERG